MYTFGVLTVSTTSTTKPQLDTAGPLLERSVLESFPQWTTGFKRIVPDDKQQIIDTLVSVCDNNLCDVLFTVGGTGFHPTDVTPEATRAVIDKEAPGLVHAITARSLAVTDMAMLSRPVCGIRRGTIILNFPGSAKAAKECFSFVKGALPHAIALVRQDDVTMKSAHEKIQKPELIESKVRVVAGAARNRKSQYPMLEVEDAKKLIYQTLAPSEELERIPIEDALTRILGEDIRAPKPVPPFPASIKDGYAVRAADGSGKRAVRSATAAGDAPEKIPLQPGEIIRISTGAPLPEGADAVVQIEDTVLVEATENGEDEKIVEILVSPKIGQDIRKVGSDIQEGLVVLSKYSRITAASIGVMAMLGFDKVKVIKRPSVGIISTGNELRSPKEPLKPGQIYDSNKVSLLGLLKSYGYVASDCGIARDMPNSVKSTLDKAFQHHDLIITSGGVSMGEYDLLKQVLIEDFQAVIQFGRVNMKPGKPTVFATLTYDGKIKAVFSLPGNPVSCCVTSLLFVLPALKYLEKDKLFKDWPKLNVTLYEALVNNDTRPEYVRLTVRMADNGSFSAKSTGKQISSRLNSMVDANALLLVPGTSVLDAGTVHGASLFGELF